MNVSPSDGGTVRVDQTAPSAYPATLTFKSGTSVRLEAVPASGYGFKNWSGDLSGTTNPTTIVIECKEELTANFSRVMHTLTMHVNGRGSTSPAVGNHSYREGTVVGITATPDVGWQFDRWTGDVADPASAVTTVTMDSTVTLTTNFSRIKPAWWRIGGIIAGVIIAVGVIIRFTGRRRTT